MDGVPKHVRKENGINPRVAVSAAFSLKVDLDCMLWAECACVVFVVQSRCEKKWKIEQPSPSFSTGAICFGTGSSQNRSHFLQNGTSSSLNGGNLFQNGSHFFQNGTGLIVHPRWLEHILKFTLVDDRITYIDIRHASCVFPSLWLLGCTRRMRKTFLNEMHRMLLCMTN